MPTLAAAAKLGTLTQRQVIEKLYLAAMAKLRRQENGSIGQLMAHYRRAQDEIVAQIYNRYGETDGWTLLQWEQSGRLRAMLGTIEEILGRLRASAMDEIIRGSEIQFFGSYDQTAWAIDQATPPKVDAVWSRPPEDAVRILVNTPYKGAMFSQRIGLITNAMASDLRDELVQSLIQGESMQAAAKRVQKVIGANDTENIRSYAYRAKTIAQTEIMRAQNMARSFSYEQNRDLLVNDTDTEWLVTPDDKLCPWCMRREGKTDAEIEAASAEADGKEDPFGRSVDQPLHPHCRCAKIPKLKSWKDLIGLAMPEAMGNDYRGMRKDNGDWSIQPVEKFESWLIKKVGDFTPAGDL